MYITMDIAAERAMYSSRTQWNRGDMLQKNQTQSNLINSLKGIIKLHNSQNITSHARIGTVKIREKFL